MSLAYLRHFKDFSSRRSWCFAILEVRVKLISFRHFCCFVFLAYIEGSRKYSLRHADSVPTAYLSPHGGFAMGNLILKNIINPHLYSFCRNSWDGSKGNEQWPTVGNTCFAQTPRSEVEHNWSVWYQSRLLLESFILQTFVQHLLCACHAVLGLWRWETLKVPNARQREWWRDSRGLLVCRVNLEGLASCPKRGWKFGENVTRLGS